MVIVTCLLAVIRAKKHLSRYALPFLYRKNMIKNKIKID